MRALLTLMLAIGLSACQSKTTLYEQLGGASGMESLVHTFMEKIGDDPRIADRFRDTDPKRFHTLLSLQLCELADGGCEYGGDSMKQVHAGMDIRPAEFNAIVEDLISAMSEEGLPQRVQNQLLQNLAPLQKDIVGQ